MCFLRAQELLGIVSQSGFFAYPLICTSAHVVILLPPLLAAFPPSLDCTSSFPLPRDGLWQVELCGTGSASLRWTAWPTDLVNPAQLCGGHLFIVLCGDLQAHISATRFLVLVNSHNFDIIFGEGFIGARRWSFFRMLGAVFALSAGVWVSQECALRPVRQRCTSTEVSHSWLSHDEPS